jgi:hypothetical protein
MGQYGPKHVAVDVYNIIVILTKNVHLLVGIVIMLCFICQSFCVYKQDRERLFITIKLKCEEQLCWTTV